MSGLLSPLPGVSTDADDETVRESRSDLVAMALAYQSASPGNTRVGGWRSSRIGWINHPQDAGRTPKTQWPCHIIGPRPL